MDDTEEMDVNCRLILIGLNVHCLANIFQYLSDVVSEMNDFYKEIIHDLLIPKLEINFPNVLQRGDLTISQVFNQSILFDESTEVCSYIYRSIILPYQFRNVERYVFSSSYSEEVMFNVHLLYNFRNLCLCGITLAPNFDWLKLINLKELYLIAVRGINSKNFKDFLRHRSNNDIFLYDRLIYWFIKPMYRV